VTPLKKFTNLKLLFLYKIFIIYPTIRDRIAYVTPHLSASFVGSLLMIGPGGTGGAGGAGVTAGIFGGDVLKTIFPGVFDGI
jgi:hypothetical protein